MTGEAWSADDWLRVIYFEHHVTGEAWPAESDLTLREQRGGDSNCVKCRRIRKRG